MGETVSKSDAPVILTNKDVWDFVRSINQNSVDELADEIREGNKSNVPDLLRDLNYTPSEELIANFQRLKSSLEKSSSTPDLGMLNTLIKNQIEPLSPDSLITAGIIKRGIPSYALKRLIDQGVLSKDEVHQLIISERTFRNRLKQKQNLSHDESDHLFRVIRVIEKAVNAFDDRDKAMRWLRKPKKHLDNKKPMDILDTDAGATNITDWLNRIDLGIAA